MLTNLVNINLAFGSPWRSIVGYPFMLTELLRRFLVDKSGTTAIEYGLIAGLVVLGIIVTVGLIGDEVLAMFTIDSEALQ